MQEGDIYKFPRFGEVVLVEIQRPRRGYNTKLKFMPVDKNDRVKGHVYYTLRSGGEATLQQKFVRKSTPKELANAKGEYQQRVQQHQEFREERETKNLEKLVLEDVEPGDVVMFEYSDVGEKAEVVESIDYRTGRVALRRRCNANFYTKARFVNGQYIRSIKEKGPGHYEPNNTMYEKYGFQQGDPSKGNYGEKRKDELNRLKEMKKEFGRIWR